MSALGCHLSLRVPCGLGGLGRFSGGGTRLKASLNRGGPCEQCAEAEVNVLLGRGPEGPGLGAESWERPEESAALSDS